MPDMNAQGPFCTNPSQLIRALVRDLVKQQRSIVDVERRLTALQAKHSGSFDEIVSLTHEPKNSSDLVALKELWCSKLLPSMVAKLAFALEVYDTYGDREVTVDDPFYADLWRSKYFAALDDMAMTMPPDQQRANGI
jgi:hypothetical protein